MTQLSMNLHAAPVASGPLDERPRLSAQAASILARLQRGPCTNHELATIALKYTGRISDLRAAGYRVEIIARDTKTGLVTYALKAA